MVYGFRLAYCGKSLGSSESVAENCFGFLACKLIKKYIPLGIIVGDHLTRLKILTKLDKLHTLKAAVLVGKTVAVLIIVVRSIGIVIGECNVVASYALVAV